MTPKPIVLLILDGWGHCEKTEHNAIAHANTPNFDALWKNYPHTLLQASGEHVGLPKGQMGNSEVGHLNMGAGRVVYQDLSRISNDIESGEFYKNEVFIKTIKNSIKNDKAIHIFGLLSPGGIHSHEKHIQAIFGLAAKQGAKKVYMHAFLDGRDTPPKSAETSIVALEKVFKEIECGKMVSLIGRFYAMDRDKRWDRIEQAYDLLTLGKAVRHAESAAEGLKMAYEDGETDEFVKATSIHPHSEDPITVNDGDSIIFMNFRADRAREITRTFIEPNFDQFSRSKIVQLNQYICLTEYDSSFDVQIAFPPERFSNLLGEWLAKHHKKQLRIAETEKYAHVTFFFNGGIEEPSEGEDRILIPSLRIESYDLQPEMSAGPVTEKLVEAIHGKKYNVIICNYANCDMVGHTGNFEATVKAVEYIDQCLKKVVDAVKSVGGEALITADHGNAEQMFNIDTEQKHTAHTSNLVPFIYVGRLAQIASQEKPKGSEKRRKQNINFKDKACALCDIAPTILYLIDLPIPKEMTGKPIVRINE